MNTGPLILLLILLLLVLGAAVVVVLVLRRNAAKREGQRVEAAGLRSEADAIAAAIPGQTAFAQQSEERAALARLEADARAREAAQLEAEAAAQREAAEATRREYETTMRRADDVDPDVTESSFAPVPDEPSDAVADRSVEDEPSAAAGSTTQAHTELDPEDADDDLPPTRAERRAAREEAETGTETGWGTPSSAAAPTAGLAGAAVAGAAVAGSTTWTGRDDGVDPESERIASAADFRDDVPPARASDEVYPSATAGSEVHMSDDTTRPEHDTHDEPAVDTASSPAADALSEDVETPAGKWGGPREDGAEGAEAADRAEGDEGAGLAIVADPEEYAATEPVLAPDQSAPVTREPADTEPVDTEPSDAEPSDAGQHGGRRISAFDELRDGGFGVGSAAPIDGGAQPLDHPVQAYRDTMTFRLPGDPGYDSAEPDVWFYDVGAAERNGFRRSEG